MFLEACRWSLYWARWVQYTSSYSIHLRST